MGDVKNELEKVAKDFAIDIGDKRIKKGTVTKAVGNFLEADIDEMKKRMKSEAKRKALRAAGDILAGFINIIFNSPPSGSSPNVIRTTENVSYTNYSAITRSSPSSVVVKAPSKYDFADLIYDSYSDAEELKAALVSVIMARGKVSVTELYDILKDPRNLDGADALIGWTDLTNAYVGMENGHYRLYMPPVVSLK